MADKKRPSGELVIRRRAVVPDQMKIALYEKAPELGPRLLFFSGGTALRDFSRDLIRFTHNSIHIMTPFDSGGSSAEIRRAFNMLSIGDVRYRLMALADQSIKGNPEIFRLFSYRLPREGPPEKLRNRLRAMSEGLDSLTDDIPLPMQAIICGFIRDFLDLMPGGFNLGGANIGNLILTAGYLRHGREIDTVIYLFSRLVEVLGIVRPVVTEDLHLAAELKDGRTIVGQHLITGNEFIRAESPIKELFLSSSAAEPRRTQAAITNDTAALINSAGVICYPMGSFYTSVLANLLPRGVGAAVAANPCPKVFVPNTAVDTEQFGLSLEGAVQKLLGSLDGGNGGAPTDYLDYVILDSGFGNYPFNVDADGLKRLGIGILDAPLVTSESYPYVDPRRLGSVLLSLT